jgi:hypothetical protein
MYLKLFHGRKHWAENMECWGFEGPVFEIKGFVHSTYNTHLWVDHKGTGNGDELCYVGDCLYYDGSFYGDWSVFESERTPSLEAALQPFDVEKARVPEAIQQAVLVEVEEA